jgi:hypothetical protein
MVRFAVLLLAVLPACATVKSGGFELPAGFADEPFVRLKNRASFDLDCPPEQLTVVTLNVISNPGGLRPVEVGVRGCGRKAVYLAREEAWLLDGGVSKSFEEPAKAAAVAPMPADKPAAVTDKPGEH